MSTLEQIEAAVEALPITQQQQLLAHLQTRLGARTSTKADREIWLQQLRGLRARCKPVGPGAQEILDDVRADRFLNELLGYVGSGQTPPCRRTILRGVRIVGARRGRVAISAIGRYEAEAVFRRKEAAGALQAGDADLFQQRFDTHVRAGLISSASRSAEVKRRFSEVLRRCLTQTPPVFFRASDTLHIATAVAEGETELVTCFVS